MSKKFYFDLFSEVDKDDEDYCFMLICQEESNKIWVEVKVFPFCGFRGIFTTTGFEVVQMDSD